MELLSDEGDLPSFVVPYLAVVGGAEALDFYVAAMGAVERTRITNDDGARCWSVDPACWSGS